MDMEKILEELRELKRGYAPNPEITHDLSKMVMVPLIGPAGTGKTTLIDYVAEHNSDFGFAYSFTTRERREDEPEFAYTFINHDQNGLSYIRDQARHGSLIQFEIHPTTDRVYGSDSSAYQSRYNLLDMLSTGVDSLKQLPFESMKLIGVACEPIDWWERFAPRLSDREDARKRINEGVISLRWLLDQGSEVAWINTTNPDLPAEAAELVGLVRGDATPYPANRAVGERLLKCLSSL